VKTLLGPTGAQVKFHNMDTKRTRTRPSARSGEEGGGEIEAYKPDLVIAPTTTP